MKEWTQLITDQLIQETSELKMLIFMSKQKGRKKNADVSELYRSMVRPDAAETRDNLVRFYMRKMKMVHYIAVSSWQGNLAHSTKYVIKARVLKEKEQRLLGKTKKAKQLLSRI